MCVVRPVRSVQAMVPRFTLLLMADSMVMRYAPG